MTGFGDHNQELIRITLCAAVPLWVLRFQREPYAALLERARECGQMVAEKGDRLMYKVKGESAEVFNALAQGVAIMSFAPGGVKWLGEHFENRHPEVTYPAVVSPDDLPLGL